MTSSVASTPGPMTIWRSRLTSKNSSRSCASGCRGKISMPEKVEDIEIQLLLEGLYRRYHYDFRNYAQASIKRRLKQAREQLGFETFSALQERLLHDPEMMNRMLTYL